MAQSQIPDINPELLMAAAKKPGLGAVASGMGQGIDLALTLEEKRRKQEEERAKLLRELAEFKRKRAAEDEFVKQVAGEEELAQKKAALAPLAPQRAVGPVTAEGVAPMTPEAPGYQEGLKAVESEASKRALLASGVRAGLSPEKAISSLYPDMGGGKSRLEQQSNFQISDPVTGKQRTVKGIVTDQGVFHPVTREKVTDLAQLPDAGYKITTNVVGRDPSTNLPVEYNDQLRLYTSGGKPFTGVVFPKLENAPASVVQSLTSFKTAKDQLKLIANSYGDKLVGPVAGRYNTVQEWLGTNDPDTAKFMAYVRTFQNSMIKAITGAQMSEPEAARLLGQLPTFKDNPQAFVQKLQAAAEAADISMRNALQTAESSGYAVQGVTNEQISQMFADAFNIKSGLTPTGEPKPVQPMDREAIKARIRNKLNQPR